jgi:hypothetical protein
MNLIDEGVIFAGKGGESTANSCFPSVTRLADGSLLASWRLGSHKDSADGRIVLSRLPLGHRLWSAAEELESGPWQQQPGELHYAPLTLLGDNHLLAALMWVDRSDPMRPFFNPSTEGLLPLQTWFCQSRDGGRSWGDYRRLDDGFYDGPLAITGPVLCLPDGRLACPFEVNKSYNDTRPWRHAAAWKLSRDGGRSWPQCVEVANDPSGRLMYWDARYAVGPDGYIIAAFWTYDRQSQRDLNVHLSESTDCGRTWSAPRDCGLVGQVCHPVLLGGNRLLLTYVDRFHARSIRCALSNDLGRTFVSDFVVYQHPAARTDQGANSALTGYLQDMELWTFGRVEALADNEGTVWIIYYAGDNRTTSIRYARLQIAAAHETILHRHTKSIAGQMTRHGASKSRAAQLNT